MMTKEEENLLLSIIYEDILLEKVDAGKLINAIKSAMKEIDELKNIQRTEQGEEIITDDGEKTVTDEEQIFR